MKQYLYIAIADKPSPQGLGIQLPDSNFPIMAAKIPFYDLEDDGNGNMVIAANPTPNASLYNRFRYNFRAPNKMYGNDETCNAIVSRKLKLKEGQFPLINWRTYHVFPVIFNTDNGETAEPFMVETMTMRAAVDQATNDTTHFPIGRLLTKSEIENCFEPLIEEV